MEELINTLKFDASGLIPAVVQNIETNEVLMVAYMNADTIKQTLETIKYFILYIFIFLFNFKIKYFNSI